MLMYWSKSTVFCLLMGSMFSYYVIMVMELIRHYALQYRVIARFSATGVEK